MLVLVFKLHVSITKYTRLLYPLYALIITANYIMNCEYLMAIERQCI